MSRISPRLCGLGGDVSLTIRKESDESTALGLGALGLRRVSGLAELKGRYRGAVFIVASGPSVADFPLERYADIPMIAVNGSIACFPRKRCDPLFYLCDDGDVAFAKSDLVAEALRRSQFAGMGAGAMERLFEKDPLALLESRLFLIERVNRWLDKPRIPDRRFAWQQRHNPDYVLKRSLVSQKANRIGFSRNFAAGYFSCRTIAYTAIQLAYFLGFSRVVMVGLDLRSSLGQFYDPAGLRVRSCLDEDYDDHILPHFRWMASKVLGPDFSVFNLSSISRLPADVLPRITLAGLDEVLER